jgi:TldD protein
MKEYTDLALNLAQQAGASFADIRIVEKLQNRVFVLRHSLKQLAETECFGYGVRVLLNGAWGFASHTRLTRDDIAKTTKLALQIAGHANAGLTYVRQVQIRHPAALNFFNEMLFTAEAAHQATLVGPCREDPFTVPFQEKAELLLAACDTMLKVPSVVKAQGSLQFMRMRRIIANTEGSYLDLTNLFTQPALSATAVVGNESQSRSYQGGARQAGYEYIRELDLTGQAKKWAEEAVIKCKAAEIPSGIMDLVLDPAHLALTMHESVGHPTELDRILGWDANMAGRSFIRPEDVGRLRFGSKQVNFTVNNQLEGGLGSCFFDDDGVKMQQFPLIKEGILVNLCTTRSTAPLIGWRQSNGCCRAQSFKHFPINRIPNLYMEPGPGESVSPQDLIAGVEKGVYIEGLGSFSIDQMRQDFQFGGDMFWLIEKGRLTIPLKKVTYQAETKSFWNSCDEIAGAPYWQTHGVMSCGKGEPAQVMFMTHGASSARFRRIQVGLPGCNRL